MYYYYYAPEELALTCRGPLFAARSGVAEENSEFAIRASGFVVVV